MALQIYTNIDSLIAHNNLEKNDDQLKKSIEKLSSGLRINHAADDASGLAIVVQSQAQIDGLNQAAQNAQDGVNLAQTADGALGQVQDSLIQARTLAVQLSNGTYSSQDAAYAQDQINQILAGVDQLGQFTNFNGQGLLTGSAQPLNFQVGAYAGQNVQVPLTSVNSSALNLSGISVATPAGAQQAIASIDAALNQVNGIRADFGAYQNRLEQTVTSVQTTSTNLTAAVSRIRDLDFAAETSKLTQEQVLQNSGISVEATSNLSPRSVLSLLQ